MNEINKTEPVVTESDRGLVNWINKRTWGIHAHEGEWTKDVLQEIAKARQPEREELRRLREYYDENAGTIEDLRAREREIQARLTAAEARVRELEGKLANLADVYRIADEERLAKTYEARDEASKWKSENDFYGYNFHEGMAAGPVGASLYYGRVGRAIKEANKQPATADAKGIDNGNS